MGFYRPPRRLTEDLVLSGHQEALEALLAELGRQLDVTWGLLDLDNLDATRAAWLRQAVAVIEDHQASAADVAAAFCQDWAMLFTGRGMRVVRPGLQADQVVRETERALDALGPAGIKERIGRGVAPQAASEQAREAVKAAAGRRVMDADRQTVMRSAQADPRTTGWRRVTHGGCKFCRMLAGRGEVYTADSVRFASHDRCRCTAAPAWGGEEVNVHQYTASKRKVTPAERAQLRTYLDGVEDDGITPKEDGAPMGGRPEPLPDRFVSRRGTVARVSARAKEPGRREGHLAFDEIVERGLLAPPDDPHRYLDAKVRSDGTLMLEADQQEHEIVQILQDRFGISLTSVREPREPGQSSPGTVHASTRTTIELKRIKRATLNATRQAVRSGSKQSPTVVVDATVYPVNEETAADAIRSVLSQSGDRIDEILILLPGDRTLRWSRGHDDR